MDKYEELMARREKLMQVWMDRFVKPAQERGEPVGALTSVGVVMHGREGKLRMPVRVNGQYELDLWMEPGDVKVTAENEQGYRWDPEED